MTDASGIELREMTLEDLPSMRRISWETWLATYAAFIPEEDLWSYFDVHYSLEALSLLFRKKTVKGFMAFVGGSAAGFVKTEYNDDEKRFYVSSLYVLPDHQGKGLGTRLLRAAELHGRDYEADRVWLGVMEQNIQALAWYRRLGFQFIEELPFTMGRSTVNHLIGYKLFGTTDERR